VILAPLIFAIASILLTATLLYFGIYIPGGFSIMVVISIIIVSIVYYIFMFNPLQVVHICPV